MSESVAVLVPSPATRGRQRGRVGAVLVVIVLVLSGAGFTAFRWLTGEHLFIGPGASETISVRTGHTIYVGLGPLAAGANPTRTVWVDLRQVHPMVTTNTSDATVSVLTCSYGAAAISLSAGGTATDPHPYCGLVEVFRSGTTSVGLPATGLLLAVTPHRAGTVEVDGAHLTYSVGIRSGSQHVGTVNLTVTTP